MKYVIISDIQGNFEAMNEFSLGALVFHRDEDICLGDIINKGDSYNDSRVVDLVRNLSSPYQLDKIKAVKGNHDEKINGSSLQKMTLDNIKYLENLPKELKTKDILAFHSSLRSPGKRLKTEEDIKEEAEFLNDKYKDYFLFGHSHKKGVFSYNPSDGIVEEVTDDRVKFEENKKYFINPGGLGLYFDLPQTLACMDTNKKEIKFYTLKEWTERRLKTLALLHFEDDLMKFLVPGESVITNMDDSINKMNQYNKNKKLDFAIALMKDYKLPESNSKRKDYLEDFSFELANEFERLYVSDVYENYSVFSPLGVRNHYLGKN